MIKEEREKREAAEKEAEGRTDTTAKLQSEKEAAVREKEELLEQVPISSQNRLFASRGREKVLPLNCSSA
jgi:hypothetical protein